MTTHTTSSTGHPALTGADRCDRCGAQAYIQFDVPITGGESLPLLMCAHHYTEHESKIRETTTAVLDERWRLQRVGS